MPGSMTTWVALLRGINVGTAKRVAMSDLRGLIEALGYEQVRTHLNSGNAVFAGPRSGERKLESAIAAKIESDLGVECKVLVRSAEDLSAVVNANPFLAGGAPIGELYATFLSEAPDPARIKAIVRSEVAPDEFEFGDRVIYTRQPNGVMATKLPNWDKALRVDATARGWKTLTKLNELAISSGK